MQEGIYSATGNEAAPIAKNGNLMYPQQVADELNSLVRSLELAQADSSPVYTRRSDDPPAGSDREGLIRNVLPYAENRLLTQIVDYVKLNHPNEYSILSKKLLEVQTKIKARMTDDLVVLDSSMVKRALALAGECDIGLDGICTTHATKLCPVRTLRSRL